MKYTDAHVHFGQRGNFDAGKAAEDLLREMDKNDIEQVFLFPIGSEIQRNETMLEAIDAHLDRFIPFAWLSPLKEGQLEWFDQAINLKRIRGLKLHPYSDKYRINDFDLLKPWMEILDKHHSHVIVHCTSGDEFCLPAQLAELAAEYPGITFQMAHMGAIWQCKDASKIIQESSNIYGDSSIASYSANVRAGLEIADKLLIGTDYPFYRFEMEHLKIQLAIEDQMKFQDVVYNNFQKIKNRIYT